MDRIEALKRQKVALMPLIDDFEAYWQAVKHNDDIEAQIKQIKEALR